MRKLDLKTDGLSQDRASLTDQAIRSRRSPGYGQSFVRASKSMQGQKEVEPTQENETQSDQNYSSRQVVTQQKGVIQKEEPASRFQLTPPSLLQPQDPASRYRLGDYTLRLDPSLDPQVQATVTQRMYLSLDPITIRPLLQQLPFLVPSAPGNIFSIAPIPAQPPLVPRGNGPDTPGTASAGVLLEAVLKIPTIDRALTTLRERALITVSRDWRQLSTPATIGVVSAGVLIAAPAIAGVISDPSARQLALDQLNGRVIPVPGVNWLSVETNLQGNNLMFGLHVEVGRLLPPILGFGPSSASPIGRPE